MQKSAHRPLRRDPRLIGIGAIVALTLYRIAMLPFSTADLFIDEAQYWLWGQELAFGYYSKPPLIGWVLRAATDLAGSDAPFWIRLPGPLFHMVTALVLIGAAWRLMSPVPAVLCGVVYASMPAVALASIFISTDTILMPFLAGAIWLYVRLRDRASVGAAIGLGLCLGLGMLAKYAAFYFVICAVLAALFVPPARIHRRDIAIAAMVFLVVISPNIVWNLQNDLVTVSHTADNVDWVRQPGISLNWSGVVDFLATQFAVFGPVFFGAYLAVLPRAVRDPDWTRRWLVWMSAPILLLVIGQALLSKAYANWAVATYLGATLLVVPWLWRRARRVFWIGLAINVLICIAVPVLSTQTTTWRLNADGPLVMKRYTGRAALSAEILETARDLGATDVVAADRHVLSDLFYRAYGQDDVSVHAAPVEGRAPHYYAQKHPYPGGTKPALYVAVRRPPPPCAGPDPDASWIAGPGAYRGKEIRAYLIPPECWK